MTLPAAAFRRSPLAFRIFPIQCHHVPEDLDQLRVEAVADLLRHLPPDLTVPGVDPYLDELVGRQGPVDLRQHRFGEAKLAGEYDRFERVGAGLEMAFLLFVQHDDGSLRKRGDSIAESERPGVIAVQSTVEYSEIMARSRSSGRWLAEHFNDDYVRQAQARGWRSRAVFKLAEIQQRDRILQPGMTVVDLGAAPGGWSQYAAEQVAPNGQVIALDLLPMEPVPGVTFLQGDFTAEETWRRLQDEVGDQPVDVVLSDMAPNMSGNRSVDQPRAMLLAELALEAAENLLSGNGCFLTKLFQGEGFEAFQKQVRQRFARVATRKPKASRARSREIYLLAQGFKR